LQNRDTLTALSADFEAMCGFHTQRKKQTEDLVALLSDRVEAETTYAMRLEKIS